MVPLLLTPVEIGAVGAVAVDNAAAEAARREVMNGAPVLMLPTVNRRRRKKWREVTVSVTSERTTRRKTR